MTRRSSEGLNSHGWVTPRDFLPGAEFAFDALPDPWIPRPRNMKKHPGHPPLPGAPSRKMILLSGSQGETAVESKRLQSGVGVHGLLKYLNDGNPHEKIDFEALFHHILKGTPRITNAKFNVRQTPAINAM